MKWIAAPLTALTLLMGAGFASSLGETTRISSELAASAEAAPKDTSAAAEETSALPTVAEMTGRQADAFDELVVALAQTGRQVKVLNGQLRSQSTGLGRLRSTTEALNEPITCTERRLASLIELSDDAPQQLREAASILRELIQVQDRSMRHLRSINRKLAPLGLLATATSAEPLERPSPLRVGVGSVPKAPPGPPC